MNAPSRFVHHDPSDIMICNQKQVFGSHFWHRAPETFGISYVVRALAVTCALGMRRLSDVPRDGGDCQGDSC